MSELAVHLRPIRENDLELFARLATDPDFSAPFEWHGFKSPEAFRRRWEEDGFLGGENRELAVALPDGTAIGLVSWRDAKLFRRAGHIWTIGAIIAPEHRAKGAGTEAQRQLAEYLFETTPAHRIAAFTEADNVAEQRALERAGFTREGVMRAAGFRGGAWRDVVVFAALRDDWPG